MNFKLGIDVGGTFTDFILISGAGQTCIHKTLSTPQDPSIGVVAGLYDLAQMAGLSFEDFISQIETIVHGTTVATNALLTLKGARTALITTKGFRDALEMRRGIREEQYNNHYRNVPPLVPRYLRFTIDERIDAQGNIISPLNEPELLSVIQRLKEEGIESVAVCYLNAFLNGAHEEQTMQLLKEHLPSCFITSSTDVLPSIRFYERLSTTVVNAYIGPVVANYLTNLTEKLEGIKFKGALLIMQSNGGVVTPAEVKKIPAVTVLSGPAAGPTAGAFYAGLMGYQDCITIDMGGTSFDASLIVDGQCVTSTDGSINRFRIALPSLDIITIGAGGGSIGWIDTGGLLQMGPQSAGALPGPVCYNRGGELPACSDANLILGYLNPDFFAGGKIKLEVERTAKAISEKIAAPLGLSTLEAAVGMYRIINTNMAQGVRQVSIERGYDPRECLFLVAGGAGPIHAGEICKELEIPLFVVPSVSSIFCAAGMLLGDLKHDYIRSYITPLASLDQDRFKSLLLQMREIGAGTLTQEGIAPEHIEFYPTLDLRYIGQYHEVPLPVSWDEAASYYIDRILKSFHAEHNRLYGYSLEDEGTEVELINVRLRALGKTLKPEFLNPAGRTLSLAEALKETRSAYVPEAGGKRDLPVYDGDLPLNGNTIPGPAIIERVNTSIFISECYDCLVDQYGSFVVYNRAAFPHGVHGNLKAGRLHD